MRRRRTRSAIADFVLGAIAIQVLIAGVYLAYNANRGLPFVTTYDLGVQLPDARNLNKGDDVRVAGRRVGFISDLRPARVAEAGRPATVAVAEVKLDRSFGRLPVDSRTRVQSASPVGLKYLELVRGRDRATYPPGATVPLARSSDSVQFDDLLALYNKPARDDTKAATDGFGNALAGRGPAINAALGRLVPLVTDLGSVTAGLAEPSTQLSRLFPELTETARQLADVAGTQLSLFRTLTTTLEAVNRFPRELGEITERTAPSQDSAIRSADAQRPFLRALGGYSSDLLGVVRSLDRGLPAINRSLVATASSQGHFDRVNRLSIPLFRSLSRLGKDPATAPGLQGLVSLLDSAAPLLQYIAPFQTVCNYGNYFFGQVADSFPATSDGAGLATLNVASTNQGQPTRLDTYPNPRPTDVPEGQDPTTASDPSGQPLQATHTQYMTPAVTADGRADCRAGQFGYPDGPLAGGSRYAPSTDPAKGGGSHVVLDPITPGAPAGPTFTGLPSLEDVP